MFLRESKATQWLIVANVYVIWSVGEVVLVAITPHLFIFLFESIYKISLEKHHKFMPKFLGKFLYFVVWFSTMYWSNDENIFLDTPIAILKLVYRQWHYLFLAVLYWTFSQQKVLLI